MTHSTKYFYKICIVGDSEVGKTSIIQQYLSKRFLTNAERTIGSNFFVKYLQLPEIPHLITLQVWDLAGQYHFKWVRRLFYKGAKGIIYVFDLMRKKSFNDILKWKGEVEKILGIVPNILVGNKVDLINPENKLFSDEEINKMKDNVSALHYFETSAKFGNNIEQLFSTLAQELYNHYDKED